MKTKEWDEADNPEITPVSQDFLMTPWLQCYRLTAVSEPSHIVTQGSPVSFTQNVCTHNTATHNLSDCRHAALLNVHPSDTQTASITFPWVAVNQRAAGGTNVTYYPVSGSLCSCITQSTVHLSPYWQHFVHVCDNGCSSGVCFNPFMHWCHYTGQIIKSHDLVNLWVFVIQVTTTVRTTAACRTPSMG